MEAETSVQVDWAILVRKQSRSVRRSWSHISFGWSVLGKIRTTKESDSNELLTRGGEGPTQSWPQGFNKRSRTYNRCPKMWKKRGPIDVFRIQEMHGEAWWVHSEVCEWEWPNEISVCVFALVACDHVLFFLCMIVALLWYSHCENGWGAMKAIQVNEASKIVKSNPWQSISMHCRRPQHTETSEMLSLRRFPMKF